MESKKGLTEDIFEPFADLCSSAEILTNVEGQVFLDNGTSMLIAIKLTFGHVVVVLAAQEDDTIKIIPQGDLVDAPPCEVRNLIEVVPWKNVAFRPLLWAWMMINQQGYFDGIQFDFAESVRSASVKNPIDCSGKRIQTTELQSLMKEIV